MAPLTPIFTREQILKKARSAFPVDADGNPDCPKKELTQYNCSIQRLYNHKAAKWDSEIQCVPFKRVFYACPNDKYKGSYRKRKVSIGEDIGPINQSANRPYTLIEVTDASTNPIVHLADEPTGSEGAGDSLVRRFINKTRSLSTRGKKE